MENEVKINSDGINVYVTLKVKAKLIGKIIMSTILVLLVIIYFIVLIKIDASQVGKLLLPLFIVLLVLIFIPGRYLFWNLFGEERVIINTKSVSYNYSYGIVQTKMKVIKYNRLGSGFDTEKMYNGTDHGTLFFVNYDTATNLPVTIFETTVIIPRDKLIEIDTAIREVFYNEFLYDNQFIPFSLN